MTEPSTPDRTETARANETARAFFKRYAGMTSIEGEVTDAIWGKQLERAEKFIRQLVLSHLDYVKVAQSDIHAQYADLVAAAEYALELLVADHGEPPSEANEGYTVPELTIMKIRAVLSALPEKEGR